MRKRVTIVPQSAHKVRISHQDYRVRFLAHYLHSLRSVIEKDPEGASVFEVNPDNEITSYLPELAHAEDIPTVTPRIARHSISL